MAAFMEYHNPKYCATGCYDVYHADWIGIYDRI